MSFVGDITYNHCPKEKPNIPNWAVSASSVLPITIANNITLNTVTLRFTTYTPNGTNATTSGNSSSLVSIDSKAAWTGFLYGSVLIQNVKSSATILYDSVDGFKCILHHFFFAYLSFDNYKMWRL